MTSHELAHHLLEGPDVPVSVIITSGKYSEHRRYRNCPLVTRVSQGDYNKATGGSELRAFIIVEK